MASTFNKIILVGHLSRDPERRSTSQGMTVTTVTLATNHRYATVDGTQEEVCFLDVTVFGRQADAVSTYLQKGSKVLVEGRVRQRHWETADGQKRSKHDVVAERVNFMDGAPQEAGAATAPADEGASADAEDVIPF